MDRRSFLAASTAIALSPLATLEAKEENLPTIHRHLYQSDSTIESRRPVGYYLNYYVEGKKKASIYMGHSIQFKILSLRERIIRFEKNDQGAYRLTEMLHSHTDFAQRKDALFAALPDWTSRVTFIRPSNARFLEDEVWGIEAVVETEKGPAKMSLYGPHEVLMADLCGVGSVVTQSMTLREDGRLRRNEMFTCEGHTISDQDPMTKTAFGRARHMSFS